MASDRAEKGPEGQSKTKVFISYSRKDMAFADRVEAALKARGFETLIDRSDIYAFEEWWKRVKALIGRADTVVSILSPDAVRPGSVALKEVAFAASLNKRFAPIVFRPVEDKSVPEELAKLNFIFFDHITRFEQSVDKLADALQTDISWIRQHTEYGESERRWSAAGRPSGLLLHSPTLEVAEHWIVSRPRGAPEPTADIRAFIAESRQEARAAQRRRRRAQALTYTLLIGIIVGLVGWINQAYLMEQWNWYTIMRPFRVANFDPYVLSIDAERALKPGLSFQECAKDCPEMVVLPAGEFMMGSPPNEQGRNNNEGPQHPVSIRAPFAVSKFDVTFTDWDACASVGGCPHDGRAGDGGLGRGTRPVVYVSWDDAQQYVAWLSRMTGKTYRLLSEAEWEYAARAGTTTAYSWGDEIGNNNANCTGCGTFINIGGSSPVGRFKPNAFGLYDMAGNVWQWVQDCYHGYDESDAPTDGSAWRTDDCRGAVVRGGGWYDPPRLLRSAVRLGNSTDSRTNGLGFRVGRTLSARAGAITVAPSEH